MEKKFQIFVSSTYEDLRKERDEVSKAILEIGDIPVGMEMFSAADETQWRLIKRQIEQSDYYLVIVAHRYGSMVDGVSYTEREYDYAVEIGVPVLGFVVDETAAWPQMQIDTDSDVRVRLEAFKAKIKSRMISFWKNADILSGKVLAALTKEKHLTPRPGWVRAMNIPGPEVLAEVARLGQEVSRLSEENSELREKASIEARFSLMDVMADDIECQSVIFMYETKVDLPRNSRYAYRTKSGGGGNGYIGGSFGRDRLQNAGVIRFVGGGQYLGLTELGVQFAEWLLKKGRKSDFFWTPSGGWGTPRKGSHEEQSMAEIQGGEVDGSTP